MYLRLPVQIPNDNRLDTGSNLVEINNAYDPLGQRVALNRVALAVDDNQRPDNQAQREATMEEEDRPRTHPTGPAARPEESEEVKRYPTGPAAGGAGESGCSAGGTGSVARGTQAESPDCWLRKTPQSPHCGKSSAE